MQMCLCCHFYVLRLLLDKEINDSVLSLGVTWYLLILAKFAVVAI